MYKLPNPNFATVEATPAWEAPEFVARLKAVAAQGGGDISAPDSVPFGALDDFWAGVRANLPPEWELTNPYRGMDTCRLEPKD